ncbi:MAG: DUF1150 family protein [Aestuariivita sp.]|nr:DUF1150 family protein [Aestuariivita sp.]
MVRPIVIENNESNVVYVKAVPITELSEEVRADVGDLDTMYAVHDSQGQQLALVSDRRMAFVLARQNNLMPFTVH